MAEGFDDFEMGECNEGCEDYTDEQLRANITV